MNPDIKALWVASLRDGSFRRGRFQLRDLDDYFDPIGVLCELAVSAGVLDQPERYDNEGGVFFGYRYGSPGDYHATGLPKAVEEWSSLNYHTAYRVAMLSDNGKTFIQIADWIEENL